MGTNYYLVTTVSADLAGGQYDSEHKRHIGKSSFGWTFSLRSYPEDGIVSLTAWKRVLSIPQSKIFNEYDAQVSIEEMLRIITERKGEITPTTTVPSGYADWHDFNAKNFCEFGPNGLARHTENERVSHGEGTWDMIIGEFS